MTRDRDEPVVRRRVDRHRSRAERDRECMGGAISPRLGRRERGQEPRRTLEEIGARAAGATSLRTADRMTADEARIVADGRAHRALRRTDVGDGAVGRCRVEDVLNDAGKTGDGDCDECELRVVERVRQGRGGLDRVAFGCSLENLRILVPAGDDVHLAGSPRRECRRGADQPRPDDG